MGWLDSLCPSFLMVLSSHTLIVMLALLLMTLAAIHNHVHTEKCPTSLPQMENFLIVSTSGMSRSSFLHFQNRSPSFQTAKPRIQASSLGCYRFLLVSLKCVKWSTTLVVNTISLFTYRSLIYAEVGLPDMDIL